MENPTTFFEEYNTLLQRYRKATEELRAHLDSKSWIKVRHWVQVRSGLIQELDRASGQRDAIRSREPALWEEWSSRWQAMLVHVSRLEKGLTEDLRGGIEEMKTGNGQMKKARKAATAFASMQGRAE